jgi:hypothetical protein
MPAIEDVNHFLPWDKSQIIRFVFLDLIAGIPERSIAWLKSHYDELGDDLRALLQTLEEYLAGQDLNVGESDTLRVFWIKFLEHTSDSRHIITSGSLADRDPAAPHSSKWASIAVLLGESTQISPAPPHLQLTYQTKWEWEQATGRGEMWTPRKDKVITECINAYLVWLETNVMPLELDNPEKMCQAMAFGLVTPDEALTLWPSIKDHESNRPEAMRAALDDPFWVESNDHRVVMAMAMHFVPYEAFSNPDCVSKSFPRFWDMMATL